MDNMTKISKIMYNKATQIQTISEAKNVLLESGELFRSLKTVLQSFSDMDNPKKLKKLLVDGLVQWKTELSRDSIDRTVRNWLNGNTQKITKKDVFILSRILHFSIEKTDEFMKMMLKEGIHWRTPEDIAWCYSIIHDLEPSQTLRLLERVKALGKLPKENSSGGLSYTAEVHQKMERVLYASEEELIAFLRKEWANFGVFHNTAYQLFMQFMSLLQDGFAENDVENLFGEMTQHEKKLKNKFELDGHTQLYQPEKNTTRNILEVYLYRKWIPINYQEKTKKDAFSAIQRSIRQNWPDEVSLSNMKNRTIDVSRKVLILLFLATDGSNSDFAEMDEDEEILTADDVFYDIHMRLNVMLQTCGFQKLDVRNPFDWMIFYCICAGDLWESDVRLKNILISIFPENEGSEE